MQNKNLALQKIKAMLGGQFLVIGAIGIIVAFSLANSNFFTASNFSNILNMVVLTGIMACSMTFVMIGGNFDLSVGSLMALCVMLSLAVHEIMGPLASVIITLLAGTMIGMVSGFLIGYLKINSLIITLGVSSILNGVVIVFSNKTVWIDEANRTWFVDIGRGLVGGIVPVSIFILLACVVAFQFVLKRTRFGQQLYAVGGNYQASRFSGINDKNVVFTTFALNGLMAALAGIILGARIMVFQLGVGTGYEFDVMTGVILGGTSLAGGRGSVVKTFIGVFILGMLQTGFVMLGMPYYTQWLIQGAVVVVVVLFDTLSPDFMRRK